MARCRIVVPDLVRLPLSDGDYIDVKRELNAGEYFDLLISLSNRQPFSTALAYLIGWSFVDADNKPVPYALDLPENTRRDTLRALDKPTMRELTAVLDKHQAAEDAARELKKKVPTGVSAS